MGLTSSMYTALTGLNASQQRLDVTGNNIANVNTVAFKGSRTVFQTELSRTLSGGSPPSDVLGGTNPVQFGLGTGLAAVQKDMTSGSLDVTGINTDVAIQGEGFFMVKTAGGGIAYTRDGSFMLGPDNLLATADGNYVQGYGVDSNFNIITGQTTNLSIPKGQLSIARATQHAYFIGNLDAAGIPATTPGTSTSEALIDITTGNAATAATSLTNLATAANPGTALFAAGNTVTLNATKGDTNVQGGSRELAPATYAVAAESTVGDLMSWIQTKTGIDTAATQVPAAGVTIGADGRITAVGNLGEANSIGVDLRSNGAVPSPMTWTNVVGDGSSKFTSLQVYDSLGAPVQVDITFVMESKATTGNTWRFFAESSDNSDPSSFLGTGTLTFDNAGNLQDATGVDLVVNRAGTGATDPIKFALDFSQVGGLATGQSMIVMKDQDGYPPGSLIDFSVGPNGIITGTFSNGLTRPLGQIVLASFANPEGLIADSNNLYRVGPDSGEAAVLTPGSLGAGTLTGGALELSNVDITKEFINMVTATTAFSAAGKVITTSNQMLQELLALTR